MPQSLRTFEDWGSPTDDAIRSGFPSNSLLTNDDDEQIREEMLLQTIAQAQAELAEIRTRRAAAKRTAFEQTHRQVRAIEDRQRLLQSHIESSERLSTPLSIPDRTVELTPWGTPMLMR